MQTTGSTLKQLVFTAEIGLIEKNIEKQVT